MNNIVELKIIDLAFDGKAVAKTDKGKVVFLNAGLTGETVRARIVSSKRRFDEAIVLDIIEKSDERIDAVCCHFDHCGGCTWQDLRYEKQLEIKKTHVAGCIERIGGLENVIVRDTVGSIEQFGYRNKMEFSFNVHPEKGFTLGLHRRRQYADIFDLEECHLPSEKYGQIVAWLRVYVRENSGSSAGNVAVPPDLRLGPLSCDTRPNRSGFSSSVSTGSFTIGCSTISETSDSFGAVSIAGSFTGSGGDSLISSALSFLAATVFLVLVFLTATAFLRRVFLTGGVSSTASIFSGGVSPAEGVSSIAAISSAGASLTTGVSSLISGGAATAAVGAEIISSESEMFALGDVFFLGVTSFLSFLDLAP